VQSRLTGDISFEEQFSNQLQFRLRCMRTHLIRFSFLLVVGDNRFEKISETFVAFGVVLARHL